MENEIISKEPIRINETTVIMITLFKKDCNCYDPDYCNCPANEIINLEQHKRSAKQLIAQLEENWTALFMMALRDEVDNELLEHDKKYGTSFSNQTTKLEGTINNVKTLST